MTSTPDHLPTVPTLIPPSSISRALPNTTNLASSALNSHVLSLSDDFFAEASNLLSPKPPVHRPSTYVSTGAWYDGWETRRHNPNPYDFVVIRLGCSAGKVRGVEISTEYFSGNHAPVISLEACYRPQPDQVEGPLRGADKDFKEWTWMTLLPETECGPNARHVWILPPQSVNKKITHVRLRMYPDGGIARLRLYGVAVPVPLPLAPHPTAAGSVLPIEELSAALNGGLAFRASDQHFGAAENLLLPGRGVDMSDGWETARSRTPNHNDWVIIKLGLPGRISRIILDTKDFRGNYPRAWRVDGWEGDGEPMTGWAGWRVLLSEREAGPDREHVYEGVDLSREAWGKVWKYVRLTMLPDGGVKRCRIIGRREVGDEESSGEDADEE